MTSRRVTGAREASSAAAELRRRARDKWAMAERTRDPRAQAQLRREADALETSARALESSPPSRYLL